jgi:hypothetical protein
MSGRRAAFLHLILATFAIAGGPAHARNKISDGGAVATCSVETAFGAIPTDGAVAVDIGSYDSSVFDPVRAGNCDPTTFQAFSINIDGTTYNQLFVNENGIVSFGAPVGDAPSTPLANITIPVFAPFFADGFLPDASALTFGYTSTNDGFANNSFWLTWNEFLPQGDPNSEPNIFQLGLVDLGGGDFDLILNYVVINWDPAGGAQAGINDGAGAVTVLNGGLIAGAYLGFDDTSGGSSSCQSATPATALACNAINDGSSIGGQDFTTGTTSNGYYLFKFRNGQLVSPTSEIPLPAAMWLFLAGAAGLAGRRALQK